MTLNEEVEEFTSRWTQSLVNEVTWLLEAKKTFDTVYKV